MFPPGQFTKIIRQECDAQFNESKRLKFLIFGSEIIFQSLKEYINRLVGEEVGGNNNRKHLNYNTNIEWSQQLNALLRYGSLTSLRRLYMDNIDVKMPKNFMEELLLHLANSRFKQKLKQKHSNVWGRKNILIKTYFFQFNPFDASISANEF
jgi:hypothetical protein